MVFKTFLAGSGIDGTAVKLTSRVRIPSNNLKIAHQRCTKVQEKFNSIAKLRKKKKKKSRNAFSPEYIFELFWDVLRRPYKNFQQKKLSLPCRSWSTTEQSALKDVGCCHGLSHVRSLMFEQLWATIHVGMWVCLKAPGDAGMESNLSAAQSIADSVELGWHLAAVISAKGS